jgi:hypothetical protein
MKTMIVIGFALFVAQHAYSAYSAATTAKSIVESAFQTRLAALSQ